MSDGSTLRSTLMSCNSTAHLTVQHQATNTLDARTVSAVTDDDDGKVGNRGHEPGHGLDQDIGALVAVTRYLPADRQHHQAVRK